MNVVERSREIYEICRKIAENTIILMKNQRKNNFDKKQRKSMYFVKNRLIL